MADTVEIELSPKIPTSVMDGIKEKFSKALAGAMETVKTIGAVKGDAKSSLMSGNLGGFLGAGKAAGGAGAAGGALGGAAALAGPIGQAMAVASAVKDIGGMVVDTLKGWIDTMGSFVRVANPAVMEQFEQVFQDINGVIGQALTPTMQMLTRVFRIFADAVATVVPTQQQMSQLMAGFAPLIDNLRDAFDTFVPILGGLKDMLMNTLIPIVTKLAGFLSGLIGIIQVFAEVQLNALEGAFNLVGKAVSPLVSLFQFVAKTIGEVIDYIIDTMKKIPDVLRKGLGLSDSELDKRKMSSSFGRSNAGAQYVGAEELGRSMRMQAFGMANPAQRTAETAEDIKQQIEQLNEMLRRQQQSPGFAGN